MNFYSIKFGPDADQASIVQAISANQGESIQMSSGLLARSSLDQAEMDKSLSSISEHITAIAVDPKTVAEDPAFSKDARMFMGLEEV